MAGSLQKRQDGDISQMLNVGDAMVGGERKKGEESGRGGEGMREKMRREEKEQEGIKEEAKTANLTKF